MMAETYALTAALFAVLVGLAYFGRVAVDAVKVWAAKLEDERIKGLVLLLVENAEKQFAGRGLGAIKHDDVVEAFDRFAPRLRDKIDVDYLDRLIRAACLELEAAGVINVHEGAEEDGDAEYAV